MPAPKDITRPVLIIVSGDYSAAPARVRGHTAIDTGIRETGAVP